MHRLIHLLYQYSFVQTVDGTEADMRMAYCAVAICAILDDWTCIDSDTLIEFIWSCQVRRHFGS